MGWTTKMYFSPSQNRDTMRLLFTPLIHCTEGCWLQFNLGGAIVGCSRTLLNSLYIISPRSLLTSLVSATLTCRHCWLHTAEKALHTNLSLNFNCITPSAVCTQEKGSPPFWPYLHTPFSKTPTIMFSFRPEDSKLQQIPPWLTLPCLTEVLSHASCLDYPSPLHKGDSNSPR